MANKFLQKPGKKDEKWKIKKEKIVENREINLKKFAKKLSKKSNKYSQKLTKILPKIEEVKL